MESEAYKDLDAQVLESARLAISQMNERAAGKPGYSEESLHVLRPLAYVMSDCKGSQAALRHRQQTAKRRRSVALISWSPTDFARGIPCLKTLILTQKLSDHEMFGHYTRRFLFNSKVGLGLYANYQYRS